MSNPYTLHTPYTVGGSRWLDPGDDKWHQQIYWIWQDAHERNMLYAIPSRDSKGQLVRVHFYAMQDTFANLKTFLEMVAQSGWGNERNGFILRWAKINYSWSDADGMKFEFEAHMVRDES
jgi:hypothetical protein